MGTEALLFEIPDWVEAFLMERPRALPAVEDRVRLAVELASRNAEEGTGGPFGAAVFDADSAELFAPGVNLVVRARCSVAHAEIVALALAERRLGSHDLGAVEGRAFELVTSVEPCAMCFGAVPWSGVRRVVCGARSEDAVRIGFDEGEKPRDWVRSLELRGIVVVRDVLRSEAAAVLRRYAESGGPLYNPGR